MDDHHSFSFGPFELHGKQRLLTRDGCNVALSGKAFSLLVVLLEHAGQMLSNDELMLLVWPGRIVDEVNIRVHINRLRKTLDIDAGQRSVIQTLSLRGYGFVGVVERIETLTRPERSNENARSSASLPFPLMPLYGRQSDLAALQKLLTLKRMVTLVGPGGVGKTELVVGAIRQLSQRVVYVDVAVLELDQQFLSAVASACGQMDAGPSLALDLSRWLGSEATLLVLDHCGCSIDSAAMYCAELLRSTPGLTILAASREPLRIHGEWVYRLAPLALPPQDWHPTAEAALNYPALKLFVDLVSEQLGGYDFSDADASMVADIARRLDGLPLAIELAAGMVAQLGLRALSSGLTNSIALLARGHRGAARRHSSLQASMDWSYDRLSAQEQSLLLRLAHFDAEFTQVCFGEHNGRDSEVAEIIGNLVLKSWVSADTSAGTVRYRLFNTVRLYLRDRLSPVPAAAQAQRHHVFNGSATLAGFDGKYPVMMLRRPSPEPKATFPVTLCHTGDDQEYA